MRLECELDTKILQCNNFSKAAMAERLYLISLLHSQCQTQFIDRSIQPAMQLPYRHPEGLLHLYAQQRPADPFMLCNLHFQGRWAGKTYQIALGFSNDADAQPVIRTFANQHETIGGGSLLDGVLEGIRHVMRLFLQTQTVQPRIRRSQITKHLVLIAAVEGHDFEYLHPTKDKLHAPQVAHAAREIVYHLMLEEQSRNPEFLHQCLRCLIDQ
jgi:DNA gyrase/topoisomerase IV subunit B